MNYDQDSGDSVGIEVYRHASVNDGFGIYSQEKPSSGTFLKVGAEGYGDELSLNFVQGRYYVKLTYFGEREDGLKLLTDFASRVGKNLDDSAILPKQLSLFPDSNLVPHSKRYVAQNFLGHSFLHSAFLAEYSNPSGKTGQSFLYSIERYR